MSVKANEFKKFFDGNSSYMSGIDFTVALGADTKVATITGLPFTLIKESVMGGMFWDITNQRLIANEIFEITTAPSVTITFTNADNFVGTEDVLFILKGPNRLSCSGGINSAVVAGGDAGALTDNAVLIAGFDGTNYRLLSVNGDGELKVNLETADIHIGAVELKNSDTDERANIKDANTARTTATKVLAVQHVDGDGEVLDASDVTDIKTAVEILDNIVDASNRAKVSPIVGQDGVSANAGASDATTLRVVSANDSPEVTNQTDGSQKSQVVDGSGNVISATSNALDVHLKSQEAGGIEVIQDTASDLNMTEANSGDIKTNQTDGSQKTQLVDGSGNVVGSTGNAVDVNLKTDNVGGIEIIQGSAANLKMTEANSADMLTALQLIDDGVHIDDAAFVAGTDKGFAILGANTSDLIDSGDYGVIKINEKREQMVVEAEPLHQKFLYEETILANIASGTTGYIYFDMDGFKSMAIQTIKSGAGTLQYTLEASIQNDGTAPASCSYQDVTSDLTGSASFTASDFHFLDTSLPIKYLRLKYVTTVDVTNLTAYSKKLY